MVGPVPYDDREAAYHRNLTGRINARYGEAVKTWAERRAVPSIDPYPRPSQQQSGPSLGL